VYGVVFDSFDPHRLLTFSDASDTPTGLVKGWDLRRPRSPAISRNLPQPPALSRNRWDLRRLAHGSPLFTLSAADATSSGRAGGRAAQSRGLLQVGWCATQRGLVGTICEGAAGLCLWDIDQMLLTKRQQLQQQQQQQQPAPPPPPAASQPPQPPAAVAREQELAHALPPKAPPHLPVSPHTSRHISPYLPPKAPPKAPPASPAQPAAAVLVDAAGPLPPSDVSSDPSHLEL